MAHPHHAKIQNSYKTETDSLPRPHNPAKLLNHLTNEYPEEFTVKSVAEPVTAALRGQLRAIRRKKDQLKKALKRPHRIVRKYLSRRKQSQQAEEEDESEEIESEVEAEQPSCQQLSEKPAAEALFPQNDQEPASQKSIKKDKYLEESNLAISAFKPIEINLFHPVHEGIRANFRITRDNSALKYFTPEFALFPEDSDSPLLFARKVSPLVFSLSLERGEWHPSSARWVGRLVSNFSGSELNLFLRLPNRAEEQLACTIVYCNSYLQFAQPRRIALYLPLRPLPSSSPSLAQVWKESPDSVRVLQSRPPRWDGPSRSYKLDFSGRATVSSVKNFILQQPSHPGRDQLVLAKQSKSCFSLGVMWPGSGVVGMAVGLSSFNGKVICE